jgi:hypothetical protein
MRCVVVPGQMTRHLNFEGAWRQFDTLAEFRIVDFVSGI